MSPPRTLRRRILSATFFTLIFILLLAGLALDKAFQRVVRSNMHEQLKNMTYALLASAEINQLGEILIPPQLPQSDINTPGSGRFAVIINNDGVPLWRSASSLGENLETLKPLDAGYSHFEHNKDFHKQPFIFRFGSVWGLPSGEDIYLTFVFVQSKYQYHLAINGYREVLVQWLGGGAILALLVHGLVLIRELRPLGRVVREVERIEKGHSLSIKGQYPAELALLSQRINTFIEKERAQTDSYRHAVDDLAHSLKTPLAVIRGMDISKSTDNQQAPQLMEQLDRMSEIIDYQLKRAAAAGKATMENKHTAVAPILRKTISSLQKVYADKHVETAINCEDAVSFSGNKDDLYEILGNLSDNAFKWCQSRVSIDCYMRRANTDRSNPEKKYWVLEVADDGPGVSADIKKEITHRGVRGDQQTPGQGIGLAVVLAIARSYGGNLEIDDSPMGGALIRVTI